MRILLTFCTAAAAVGLLSACSPSPKPLQYGLDECDHCRMTLMDERYGGEIVTRTGKTYTFDSVECLAAFAAEESVTADQVYDFYVVDYGEPRTLIQASTAHFLKSTQLLSPMGAGLTSFRRDQDARGSRDVFGGELLTWDQARASVTTEWLTRSTSSHGAGS